MSEYNHHSLKVEIKDYFVNNKNNPFIERLRSLIPIESIEVFPDDPEHFEVTVVFKEQKKSVTNIIFLEEYASLEYTFDDYFVNIPFSYGSGNDENSSIFDLISIYDGYGIKGMQQLFDDMFFLIKKIVGHEVYIESIAGKKKTYSKFMEKLIRDSMMSKAKDDATRELFSKNLDEYFTAYGNASVCLTKCRIYFFPNETIAYSRKWKEKYKNSPKLVTACL